MSEADKTNSQVRGFGFRAPRFPVNFNFSFQVGPVGAPQEATCTDISEDGLAAELLQSLSPKTEVTLLLLFPGSTAPVRIKACVGYQEERRNGFTFLYGSTEERAQVKAYVQSVKPKTLHMRGQG